MHTEKSEELLDRLLTKASEDIQKIEGADAIKLYAAVEHALAQKKIADNFESICQAITTAILEISANLSQVNLQQIKDQIEEQKAR